MDKQLKSEKASLFPPPYYINVLIHPLAIPASCTPPSSPVLPRWWSSFLSVSCCLVISWYSSNYLDRCGWSLQLCSDGPWLHMVRSSQPQQKFVENVFFGFLDPLVSVLPEYGSLWKWIYFYLSIWAARIFWIQIFLTHIMWVQDPSKWGYPPFSNYG